MSEKSTNVQAASLLVRQLALAAMIIPMIAVARTTGIWASAILASIGLALGNWYSYRHQDQEKGGRWFRFGMFVALHVAFCAMCVGLTVGISYPQAQFAIFAQVITSFDLRARRSVFNTLIHSLINLYIAATVSRTAEMGLYLLAFAAFTLAAFFVAGREDGLRGARLLPKAEASGESSTRTSVLGLALRYTALSLAVIFVVFLFTPRFANKPFIPPFSITIPQRGGVKSEIINPGVPLVQVNGWSDGESDYFYGFDSTLDLRYRGGLSDVIVMYVSSPSRSYWRSHSYDSYDGISWSQSDNSLVPLRGRVSFYVPPYDRPPEEQEVFQTFTIVHDQPNLLFAAYRPAQIYMAATQVAMDSGGGLRSPQALSAGTTYSVLSRRPNFDPAELRLAQGEIPAEVTSRYLQLPDNISERVRALARELTAPHDNTFDKVAALNEHLLTYKYNFFPPPHPPGAEVVDNFLFVDKEGVCEHYVTALVVMARSLGIPARIVTGYGPGDYNRLTGYYEVRASHAHSWAEVYFPEHGWVPFDPTPGWDPAPYPTPVQTWFLSGGTILDLDIPVSSILSAGMAGASTIGPFVAGALLIAVVGFLLLLLNRRVRAFLAQRLANRYSTLAPDRRRSAILKLYRTGASLLARRYKRTRTSGETLTEYATSLGSQPLARLTEVAEVAAYRPTAPDDGAINEAEAALAAIRAEMATRKA